MTGRETFSAARRALLYSHERKTSLCDPFLSVLPVEGAAVSVLAGSVGQSTVCASDDTAARLDEMQFDLGEGPCWDALSTRRPVLHSDIDAEATELWPLFTAAIRADPVSDEINAVYAFPLFVGSLDIGAVDLYSLSTVPLGMQQVTDASELATLAAWQVLRRVLGADVTELDVPAIDHRREVHQATGMILAQLGISAEDASLLLRAHAFSSGRTVLQVATDIVERRLDFAADGTP